ncbi:MAG TPA: PTS sugar transporter subunit IIA [Thermoanaerobaculia bacterium]|jgi:mannitol/fructose-specific phosphotransferase system IIA component (Ntr-type)
MDLSNLLTLGDVVFSLRASDIGAAAAQLLTRTLPQHGYTRTDVDRLIQRVLERERQSPTLCGPMAIPHARDNELEKFVGAIGVNREGVITGSPSPRVIVTFVSPDHERSEHLALLSSIARLSRDQDAVSGIADAGDAQTVIDLVRAHRA